MTSVGEHLRWSIRGTRLVLSFFLAVHSSAPAQNVTLQQPTFGVSVDADGLLHVRELPLADMRLGNLRAAAAQQHHRDQLDIEKPSVMRKVSLRRLEAALEKILEEGHSPDEELLYLAGLQRINSLFVFPEHRDVVVAGPAQGWAMDETGRVVGQANGQPVLRLEDLITALRVSSHQEAAWFGCTIDPTQQALMNVSQLNQQLPKSIPVSDQQPMAIQLRSALEHALGHANIRVFGVPADTRMAKVMVEADYRMKRIALGVEPTPRRMATFAGLLKRAPKKALQRWWLVPNYGGMTTTEDRLSWQFGELGVELRTENYDMGVKGELAKSPAPASRASRLFATSFTAKYSQLAQQQPVFAELRNMIDLLVMTTALKRERLFEEANWRPTTLQAESSWQEPRVAPRAAKCVVNVFWRGNRLLAPAGGGVTIVPAKALGDSNLTIVSTGELSENRQAIDQASHDTKSWWWD